MSNESGNNPTDMNSKNREAKARRAYGNAAEQKWVELLDRYNFAWAVCIESDHHKLSLVMKSCFLGFLDEELQLEGEPE